MEPSDAQSTAAETGESGAPQRAPGPLDLEDPSLYFNRELSWLDFNERVLQLAEDPAVPLLERVNFCAICESNLDEFYMVRVADLHDQLDAGIDARGADGMAPSEQIDAIRQRVLGARRASRAASTATCARRWRSTGSGSSRRGRPTRRSARELDRLFESSIFPALTPLAIGLGRPFPYISNLSLSLAVLLRDPDQGTEVIARVKVPKELLGRFVAIGDGGRTLVPLEDVIAAQPRRPCSRGWRSSTTRFFRVTRDTDYDVSDEADDLLQAVEEELRRRRFGEVVRLEVEPTMSARLRDQLMTALKIDERAALRVRRPARHVGPVGRVRGRGLRRASRPPVQPRSPSPASAARTSRTPISSRDPARGRRPRASPL